MCSICFDILLDLLINFMCNAIYQKQYFEMKHHLLLYKILN